MVKIATVKRSLGRHLDIIDALLEKVTAGQARWKPAPDKWSILEVINHLVDEEREDFRQRLDYTLHRPGESWPGIDPQAWVVERKYNSRALRESFGRFSSERKKTLEWLGSLANPDLNRAYDHPLFGIIRAGDLLTSWMAHDLMHIRQIAMLKTLYLEVEYQPYSVNYASP